VQDTPVTKCVTLQYTALYQVQDSHIAIVTPAIECKIFTSNTQTRFTIQNRHLAVIALAPKQKVFDLRWANLHECRRITL